MSLKQLQKQWYLKLKQEGFNDIEQDGRLISYSSSRLNLDLNKTVYDAKLEYSRLANEFLEVYQFEDAKDKEVWSMYVDGLSARKISETLIKSNNHKFTSKSHVAMIIKRLEKIMLGSYL